MSETFPVCCTTVPRTVLLSSMRDQPLASSISTVLLVLRPNVCTGSRPFLAAGTSFRSTTAFRVSLLAVLFYFLLLSTICRDNQGSIVTFCKASDSSPSRLTFSFSGLYFQSGILGKSLRNSHSEQRCKACTILQAPDLRSNQRRELKPVSPVFFLYTLRARKATKTIFCIFIYTKLRFIRVSNDELEKKIAVQKAYFFVFKNLHHFMSRK